MIAALRTLQSREASWARARDMLLRVVGNIVSQPHVEKYRSIKRTPGSVFADAVYSKPGGRELMAAMGFVERPGAGGGGAGGDAAVGEPTLWLPPGAPLEPCRLAHAHVERSTTLTKKSNKDKNRWKNHACSVCRRAIHSGLERVWTSKWDAPKGEFRYRCEQCSEPEYNLCESCWDVLQQRGREGEAGDGAAGGAAGGPSSSGGAIAAAVGGGGSGGDDGGASAVAGSGVRAADAFAAAAAAAAARTLASALAAGAGAGAGGGRTLPFSSPLAHDASHTYEIVPPIESRHDTSGEGGGGGPWGNGAGGGSISGRSRERLRCCRCR